MYKILFFIVLAEYSLQKLTYPLVGPGRKKSSIFNVGPQRSELNDFGHMVTAGNRILSMGSASVSTTATVGLALQPLVDKEKKVKILSLKKTNPFKVVF